MQFSRLLLRLACALANNTFPAGDGLTGLLGHQTDIGSDADSAAIRPR